jgi:hypothetical protein
MRCKTRSHARQNESVVLNHQFCRCYLRHGRPYDDGHDIALRVAPHQPRWPQAGGSAN